MFKQERAIVLGFKFAWGTFGYLPKSLLRTIANFVADRIYSANGAGVKRLTFNISRVIGSAPLDEHTLEVSRQAMRSYMRYWADMFALSKRSDTYISKSVIVRNEEDFKDAVATKNGVVIAVTHSGNWDLAGAHIALKYNGITTVAERLRPVELFDEFSKHRRSRKIEILPHRGGAVPPSVALANDLRAGKLIGLVADRDMSHHGVEIEFFGHTAKMPLGAAKLAIENNAKLFPAAVYEESDKTIIEFYPAIDTSSKEPIEVTQKLAKTFEIILRAHPENWHMLQRIWLDMPSELEDIR